MAIKEVKREWDECQLDYVKEFILHCEDDVANLPKCCIGSTAIVSATGNVYVCGQGKVWKLREEAMKEGPGAAAGGVTSWNDLTDKPVVTETTDTLTVPAITEAELEEMIASGTLVGGWFLKVSDKVLSMSDLENGFAVVLFGEPYEVSAAMVGEMVLQYADGVLAFLDALFSVDEQGVGVDLGDGIMFPEKGLYLNIELIIERDFSITVPGYIFHCQTKFDTSLLYKPDWNQNDESAADFIKNRPFCKYPTGGDTLTWDGDIEGKRTVAGLEGFYKISDTVTTVADLENGGSVVMSNGETYEFTSESIGILTDGIVFIPEAACFISGMHGSNAGSYLRFSSETGHYTASVTINSYTGFPVVKRLDAEYLPAQTTFYYNDYDSKDVYLYTDKGRTAKASHKDVKTAMLNKTLQISDGLGTIHFPSSVLEYGSYLGVICSNGIANYSYIIGRVLYTAEYVPPETTGE